jgi:hypothetical protein
MGESSAGSCPIWSFFICTPNRSERMNKLALSMARKVRWRILPNMHFSLALFISLLVSVLTLSFINNILLPSLQTTSPSQPLMVISLSNVSIVSKQQVSPVESALTCHSTNRCRNYIFAMARSTGALAALATVLIALGTLLVSPTTLTDFPSSTIFVQLPDITLDTYGTAIPKAASILKQLPLLERHHDYLPYNSETNTYTCPANNPDGNFCMNVGGFYIIRCHNGVGNPGNCSANLVGRPPIETGYSPCWDTSITSGTAVCSKK